MASSKKRNNKMVYGLIVVLVVAVFVGSLMLLKSVYQTETYYVLKEDVPTRTQINADMLEPVTTSAGTAPKSALGISEVQDGYMFTKYPLKSGDILTDSNVGGFEDVSVGVPDSWVVTSFGVNADNAVGGRIQRGTYFDMMVSNNSGAFYPFVNMLALDTTVSMDSASSSEAAESEEAHQGQTTQYVVGMPPAEAAKLANIMKSSGGDVKLVLSPRQNEYNPPQLAQYSGMFKYDNETKDLGKGTDYTFTPLKRDKFGKPVSTPKNCSHGNAKVNCSGSSNESPNPDENENG